VRTKDEFPVQTTQANGKETLSAGRRAAMHRALDRVLDRRGKAKDVMPHKFEPMPGNRKNQPCNRCLEYKNHPNHKPAKDVKNTQSCTQCGGTGRVGAAKSGPYCSKCAGIGRVEMPKAKEAQITVVNGYTIKEVDGRGRLFGHRRYEVEKDGRYVGTYPDMVSAKRAVEQHAEEARGKDILPV
jgi:hypothetical protein